jgi:hypothetical protein
MYVASDDLGDGAWQSQGIRGWDDYFELFLSRIKAAAALRYFPLLHEGIYEKGRFLKIYSATVQ